MFAFTIQTEANAAIQKGTDMPQSIHPILDRCRGIIRLI
jgi:hypothetical protein